ncbi:MAG: ADP-glyceromanno-heptose 6-epimerase [Chlamydiota bacterium]
MQEPIYPDEFIIITGAAGFIGSGIVRHLNNLGRKNLLLIDDFGTTEKWKNLLGKEFVDLLSKKELFAFLEKKKRRVGAILHLGACSSTTEKDADYLMQNNYRYSVDLAKYAIREKVRFIYASSAATYGGSEKDFNDREEALLDLAPLNMYGFSKHLFDLWLKQENLLDRVVGLKYFNVFGPNEYHKGPMASMVLKMAKKAALGDPIELFKSNHVEKYADGEQKRDFIYVKDAVRFTCIFLETALQQVHGIFNIGSGVATSWNTLANALFAALDKPPQIKYIDMPQALHGQYQNYTKASMEKFFAATKPVSLHAPITSIESAVKDYVQNYILPEARW